MGNVIQLHNRQCVNNGVLTSKSEPLPSSFTSLPKALAVLTGHILDPEEFWRLVDTLCVSMILDMRTAPRLDIVAPTRLQAFKCFESRSIKYRDIRGLASVGSCTQSDLQKIRAEVLASIRPEYASTLSVIMLFDGAAFRDVLIDLLQQEFEFMRIDAILPCNQP